MRKLMIFTMPTLIWLASCTSARKTTGGAEQNAVKVSMDLVNVTDDRVKVTVTPPAMAAGPVTYQLPKIIPGTYAIADYGRYVDDFRAFDKSGKELPVSSRDSNTWVINATGLYRIIYKVNDTYDNETGDAFQEGSRTIFSPAGTNILAGKNFMLNLCGFVGYFNGQKEIPYEVAIQHPAGLSASSALNDMDPASTSDLFRTNRYAELMDCPVMYAAPDISTFKIDDMDVLLSVYSPRKKSINAAAFTPDLQKMVRAQKNFLGKINHTKKYAVLTYITSNGGDDARGIGALEHNTSTTSVFTESMTGKDLIDVIAHEFFHTLTPLNVHSREIQYFDFNEPKMSEHLWLYEGVTEYFANLFQVNQGLIPEDDFYARMAKKELTSKYYNDTLSMTRMSKNVLDDKMKAQYTNVYQKGALLAMCIDIILREKSNGQRGILSIMGDLSGIYGPEKPFDDAELIPQITKITYPEVGDFIQRHIVNGEPVDYAAYLRKMGMDTATVKVPEDIVFMVNRVPYLYIDTAAKQLIALTQDGKNNFYKGLGVENGDVLLEMNGQPFDISNPTSILMMGYDMTAGSPVTLKVKRDGRMVELKGNVTLNYRDGAGYRFTNPSKLALKNAWLKG